MNKSLAVLVGILTVSAFLAIPWALPQWALAASFNCHRNIGLVERTICENVNLSAMDDEMAYLYFQIINDLGRHGAQEALNGQRHWLDQRNECGANEKCLVTLYRSRIEAFHDVLGLVTQVSQ